MVVAELIDYYGSVTIVQPIRVTEARFQAQAADDLRL